MLNPRVYWSLYDANSKLTSKNPCGTNKCSCRENGLKCVTACDVCRGKNCKNLEEVEEDDTIDEQILNS